LLFEVIEDHDKSVRSKREQDQEGNEIQAHHEITEKPVFENFLAKEKC
jgi:hypothetical protein